MNPPSRSIASRRAGFRLDLPAGDSLRWAPGETREVTLVAYGGRRSAMPDRARAAEEHACRHGPTAGDRVRLGDTDLWIRVERDLTEPGDQALWGYAKNWRSRMTQHDAATRASELDAVIGSVIVVDPLLGVVKATSASRTGGSPGSAAPATPTSPTAST